VTRWLSVLLARLGTRTVTVVVAVLFLVSLVTPDPLPVIDELLLGAATVLVSRWRQRSLDAR
jgi:hypothetical protein